MNTFTLIDSATFEKLCVIEPKITEQLLSNKYCKECRVPMNTLQLGYQCGNCGLLIEEDISMTNELDSNPAGIHISTGHNKGKMYNVSTDYTKIQLKTLLIQLLQKRRLYKGSDIPKNVLLDVAKTYNDIQKSIIEEVEEDGKIVKKRFVKRGSIKDEVLGALIYFECRNKGLVRKKSSITEFMNLKNGGFARGESILRNLIADNKINITLKDETITDYTERYFEALNITEDCTDFVVDLVNVSEKTRLGMNSQISSKIVGAIWVLICSKKMGITFKQLEKATDDTKKNTFIKFYNIVRDNKPIFDPIFVKHSINFE